MSTSTNLLDAFSINDRERINRVISDLCPAISGPYMLVGGAAIRYGLLKAGDTPPQRPFNDLDLVTVGPDNFNSQLREHFLIHHYHADSEQTDFRFVLVHKATNTKVDIFHWKPAVFGTVQAHVGPYSLPVQDLETQFAVTVYDMEMMRRRGPVDPKQLRDAQTMEPHIDGSFAKKVWSSLFGGQASISLDKAFLAAIERHLSQPAEFQDSPWKIKPPYRCAKCDASLALWWPIANMDDIYHRLGYVELDGDNLA